MESIIDNSVIHILWEILNVRRKIKGEKHEFLEVVFNINTKYLIELH